MSTHHKDLKKGLKFVFGAIPLIVFSPVLLNIGFSAIKKDENYMFFIIGIIAGLAAIVIVANGIRIILRGLFS